MNKENKFVKVLIACGVTYDLLTDYEWEVIELELHKLYWRTSGSKTNRYHKE